MRYGKIGEAVYYVEHAYQVHENSPRRTYTYGPYAKLSTAKGVVGTRRWGTQAVFETLRIMRFELALKAEWNVDSEGGLQPVPDQGGSYGEVE